jgi:hypothetical protein
VKPTIKTNSTLKLSALMLSSIMLMGTMVGCTQQQVATKVAQDIVNWTPMLESGNVALQSLQPVLAIADPLAADVVARISAGVAILLPLQAAAAQAYLANPTGTTLGGLQAAITNLQQNINAAVLTAVKVTNPASQAKILADLQLLAVGVNAVFALVQSISTKSAVTEMNAQSPIKLKQVMPYLDREQAALIVAKHYSEPLSVAKVQVRFVGYQETQAGF